MKRIFWCKNCLNMSTRPRITFDKNGLCNACEWMNEKQVLNWKQRLDELKQILDTHRSSNGNFDCIVPVSGGKDGSYVAYKLKHEFNMNPLTVTVKPPLSLSLGDTNLQNFIKSGYDHIHITPNYNAMKVLNKTGFIEMGSPYYGWLTSVMTAVIRTAISMNISLVFYGESGEVEYGGSSETKYTPTYDIDYMKRVYLTGGHKNVLEKSGLNDSELFFFKFPSNSEIENRKLSFAHWSYFENWDSYRNYLVAKEHCGLQESDYNNIGTFTNFAQNDQALASLHYYLMYLKFGFGRATQDAGIEIRRGAIGRDQAINLVNIYDGEYPEKYIEMYLDYYQMDLNEFNNVIDFYANKKLFKKVSGIWQPNFSIQ